MMGKLRKMRGVKAAAKKISKAEVALSAIEPVWMRHALRDLLRLEEKWDADDDLNALPAWAETILEQLLCLVGMRFPKIATWNEESFGRTLGQKAWFASLFEGVLVSREKANDATRAKITKLLGGVEGVRFLQELRPMFREIMNINRRILLKKIEKLPVERRGRFYRGYGNGLLTTRQMQRWQAEKGKRLTFRAYKQAFAVLHWEELEAHLAQGGWSAVGEFFVRELPEGVEISEESFIKTLKMVGMKSPRKAGRPRKSGSKSSGTS